MKPLGAPILRTKGILDSRHATIEAQNPCPLATKTPTKIFLPLTEAPGDEAMTNGKTSFQFGNPHLRQSSIELPIRLIEA